MLLKGRLTSLRLFVPPVSGFRRSFPSRLRWHCTLWQTMRTAFTKHLLPRQIALIAACCVATACCGCGAIGLYSLGHSLLSHNHVLKPILPDDGEEAEANRALPTRGLSPAADSRSSRGGGLPMEKGPDDAPSAETSGASTGETIGE